MPRIGHRSRYSLSPSQPSRFLSEQPRAKFALPGQSYQPNLNRAALTGARAERQLARDLADLAAIHGGATDMDLETLGWKKVQLASFGEAARALAQRDSVREVA